MLSHGGRAAELLGICLVASLSTASPAWAAGGDADPVHVRGDNKGGTVDTTVVSPGSPGSRGAATDVAVANSASTAASGVTCTSSFPGDGGQLFREDRDGVPGRYYFRNCYDQAGNLRSHDLVWTPDFALPQAGAGAAGATPAQLAQQAVGRLPLPAPQVHHNPDATAGRPQTVVGVATWLWVAGASYRTLTQTVAAGPVWATVTARPVSTYWQTGSADAADVRCTGPGVAYDSRRSPDGQSTYCSTVYRRSSAGQPQTGPTDNDRFFVGSATTRWQVSWVGAGGAAGQLPDLERTSSFRLAVAEVQSVNY